MIARHHEDRWTKLVTNWNPEVSTKQEGYRQQGRPAKMWEDDRDIYSLPDRSSTHKNDLAGVMAWLTPAGDSSEWDAL